VGPMEPIQRQTILLKTHLENHSPEPTLQCVLLVVVSTIRTSIISVHRRKYIDRQNIISSKFCERMILEAKSGQ
jgi:hypothetical protein